MSSRSPTRLFALTLLAAIASGACSGPEEGSAGAGAGTEEESPAGEPTTSESAVSSTSGSRLKARYLKATDGATHFLSWFDTKRNEECEFALDAPGHYRCVPRTAAYARSAGYSDPACTKPLVSIMFGLHREKPGLAAGDLCPAPAYALVMSGDPYLCEPTVTTVYAGLTTYSGDLYAKRGSACENTGTVGAGWWTVGAEIPVTEFVEATIEQEK